MPNASIPGNCCSSACSCRGLSSQRPASTPKSKSPNRSKHGRQKLPDHLPRLPIEHDLDESEKACPCCGQERQRIGQEKNEQLEHLPSNFVVLEHIRHKYACPHCNSGHCQKCDGKAHIDLAAKPQQPIERGLAGPGLLAYVVTSQDWRIICRCTGWNRSSPANR